MSKSKYREHKKTANVRAKYGARGKPAPVTVKLLDGTVLHVVDQNRITQEFVERKRRYARRARGRR